MGVLLVIMNFHTELKKRVRILNQIFPELNGLPTIPGYDLLNTPFAIFNHIPPIFSITHLVESRFISGKYNFNAVVRRGWQQLSGIRVGDSVAIVVYEIPEFFDSGLIKVK